jgi:hypothetical protein
MPSFEIHNRHVIGAFNAASNLQSWLRPGLLAYIVGTHVESLRPQAVRLFNERAAMLDEAAQKYPDKTPDGTPHPLAGQLVVEDRPGGVQVNPFRSAEAGREFERREHELMDATTRVVVDLRLTLDHIRRLDAERLPAPKGNANGASGEPVAVDFAALMVLVEREPEPDESQSAPASQTASAA